jgi:hypothetical protein
MYDIIFDIRLDIISDIIQERLCHFVICALISYRQDTEIISDIIHDINTNII